MESKEERMQMEGSGNTGGQEEQERGVGGNSIQKLHSESTVKPGFPGSLLS